MSRPLSQLSRLTRISARGFRTRGRPAEEKSLTDQSTTGAGRAARYRPTERTTSSPKSKEAAPAKEVEHPAQKPSSPADRRGVREISEPSHR